MVLLRWVLFWFLAPAAALALDLRPAENPPEDFAGRQYIDSRGCVFLRSEQGGWDARQTADGQAICGYPPTLSQRGLDGRPRLRALDPDAGKSRAQLVEEALTRAVIPNLRAGELSSDARPLEALPDMGPEPHDTAPMDALRGALQAAPAVRAQMTRDLQPNRRLCALLGYDDAASARGGPGALGDPTKGYCGALPDSDLSRLAFARPIGTPLQPVTQARPPMAAVPAAKPSAIAAPNPRLAARSAAMPRDSGKERAPAARPLAERRAAASPAAARPPVSGQSMGKPGPAASVAAAPPAARPAPTASAQATARPTAPPHSVPSAAPRGPGMIPAGARFVQIGRFADADAAERAARTALGLGYPVLRGKGQDGKPFLLAGPFDSREAIVRALNGLRRAGFRNAYPR